MSGKKSLMVPSWIELTIAAPPALLALESFRVLVENGSGMHRCIPPLHHSNSSFLERYFIDSTVIWSTTVRAPSCTVCS